MTTDFTATFHGIYIRVEHPRGCELTEQGVTELWRKLAELCEQHPCCKVLSLLVAP